MGPKAQVPRDQRAKGDTKERLKPLSFTGKVKARFTYTSKKTYTGIFPECLPMVESIFYKTVNVNVSSPLGKK